MRPHEFAERLGVSVKTLHRWDESGKLKAKRTPSNHRYYTEDDLAVAKGLQASPSKRQVIVYCRVSSSKQKNELLNQKQAMERFCLARGLAVDEYICEIGGGMNFKRREFIRIVTLAIEGKIETLVVAHKDRLCRFAFELIEALVEKSGCQIIVANQESLSPQQELVEDMLAIVHSFSCRIYGSRSYANQKTKAFSELLDIPRQKMLTLRKDVQA
jgi:predicted site-specific integrase-resolvase